MCFFIVFVSNAVFHIKELKSYVSASSSKMWSLTENPLSSCRCFMDSLFLFALFYLREGNKEKGIRIEYPYDFGLLLGNSDLLIYG